MFFHFSYKLTFKNIQMSLVELNKSYFIFISKEIKRSKSDKLEYVLQMTQIC